MTQPQRQTKRLTVIELNEFAVPLLQRGAEELGLVHVARLLSLPHSTTTTDDRIEHRGLDPWVQWVSVHTGVPSSVHGIIHLGDTPSALGQPQLWETLSRQGVTSGIWGAMNATRAGAEHCLFFLPDPWTFSEEAYPAPLNDLLALPRYYSKNYLDVSFRKFALYTLRLAKFVATSGALAALIADMPLVLRGILRNGVNNAVLFSLFDLFSASLFVKYRRKCKPQLSVIFLNSIAHLQHHRWSKDDRLGRDLEFGLRVIDRVLGILFDNLEPGEGVIVMNALTQRNIVGEKPRICYRQVNPARFLESIGLEFRSVEQLMTNDAHVFFENPTVRDQAADLLEKAMLEGVPLFHVERNPSDPRKLFYQVDFWDEVTPAAKATINGREIRFLEYFEAIVARTGAHVPEGDVFASGINFPVSLHNSEVASRVLAYFREDAGSVDPVSHARTELAIS